MSLLVKEISICIFRWVLKCHACYKVTTEIGRIFCPSCGNGGTLRKVAVTVGENGIVIAARRPRVSLRGTKVRILSFSSIGFYGNLWFIMAIIFSFFIHSQNYLLTKFETKICLPWMHLFFHKMLINFCWEIILDLDA